MREEEPSAQRVRERLPDPPDLRRKLLFVLMIIVIFRAGSQIPPAPGVHVSNVEKCIDIAKEGENAGLYSLVNLFSGGALLQLTIFALGIMPYITASIILQLLVVVIPRLEALKKEGQAGQTKITQYTRYLTLGLAVLQATGIVALARTGNLLQGCEEPLLHSDNTKTFLVMVVTMTAGTAVIMWLGELITERGVGNGMSILIFTQVVATFPISLWQVKITQLVDLRRRHRHRHGPHRRGHLHRAGPAPHPGAVRPPDGRPQDVRRQLDLHPAQGQPGRHHPVIFASSLLYLPAMAVQFNQQNPNKVIRWVNEYLVDQSHPIHMAAYFLLIIFFTYFYVSITFNPQEVADNMKKYGGFIPRDPGGQATQDYLSYVLSRITLPGSLYLGLISLVPLIAFVLIDANQNFPFGGTSILIMVGVALDTVKQIESQLQQRNYEGFLR